MASESQKRPLNIIIVGAGIAGLATAVGLRQNGHNVTVYEQTGSGAELGAAVILAPNAHGIIKRLGIDAEKDGAIARKWHTEYTDSGRLLGRANVGAMDGLWQHTGILCRRYEIHSALKSVAVAAEGPGRPVALKMSSRVKQVIPETATVVFEDLSTTAGDLVIGADGIKSATRTGLHDLKPFPSGKSAYRFLVDRSQALGNANLGDIVQREGEFSIWYGTDRRVWLYTTHFNRLINVVCMLPDSLSEASNTNDAFGNQHDVDHNKIRMLEIFKDFDPRLVALLKMAEASSVRLWRLLDMDPPPVRQKARLGLVGDAALPFLPHIGQGAACALEDAACITTLFGPDIQPCDVPERLHLYEECRKSRAEEIHSFSRMLGYDLEPGNEDAKLNRDLMAKKLFPYIFDHDEFDHSAQKLRDYEYAKRPTSWIMPTSFGPLPRLQAPIVDDETSISSVIKFKTSKTQLRNLLPKTGLTFTSIGSVAVASFTHTQYSNVSWLAGQSYSELAFHIHSVHYEGQNSNSPPDSTFLAVSFVDSPEVLIRSREMNGIPMVFCNFEVQNLSDRREIRASWNNRLVCQMEFRGTSADMNGEPNGEPIIGNLPSLTHRYVPAVGAGLKPVADSIICDSRDGSSLAETKQRKKRGDSSLKLWSHSPKELPTLHHILEPLAKLPIFEILDSYEIEGSKYPEYEEAKQL